MYDSEFLPQLVFNNGSLVSGSREMKGSNGVFYLFARQCSISRVDTNKINIVDKSSISRYIAVTYKRYTYISF